MHLLEMLCYVGFGKSFLDFGWGRISAEMQILVRGEFADLRTFFGI